MAALRKRRPSRIQCTFVYSREERDMLEQLATADDRSAASWLRTAIRREYEHRFGMQKVRTK